MEHFSNYTYVTANKWIETLNLSPNKIDHLTSNWVKWTVEGKYTNKFWDKVLLNRRNPTFWGTNFLKAV